MLRSYQNNTTTHELCNATIKTFLLKEGRRTSLVTKYTVTVYMAHSHRDAQTSKTTQMHENIYISLLTQKKKKKKSHQITLISRSVLKNIQY